MSDETYVKDGTSRTLLGLVVLFFVLGIVIFIIGAVIGWDEFKRLFRK